jgi:putative membrane protein insertion efficiency factor
MKRGMPLASALATGCAIGAVRTYQWTVRPMIGPNCRFWPSCSDYAIEAFRQHGALRGSALAARRILRCNPWHAGGVDLVPGRVQTPPAPTRDEAQAPRQRDDHDSASDRVGRQRTPSHGGNNFVTAYREQARGPSGPAPMHEQRARGSQMGH